MIHIPPLLCSPSGWDVRVKVNQLKLKRVGYAVPGCVPVGGTPMCQCRPGDVPAGTSEDFGVPLCSAQAGRATAAC